MVHSLVIKLIMEVAVIIGILLDSEEWSHVGKRSAGEHTGSHSSWGVRNAVNQCAHPIHACLPRSASCITRRIVDIQVNLRCEEESRQREKRLVTRCFGTGGNSLPKFTVSVSAAK